jgi:hypothetical protein
VEQSSVGIYGDERTTTGLAFGRKDRPEVGERAPLRALPQAVSVTDGEGAPVPRGWQLQRTVAGFFRPGLATVTPTPARCLNLGGQLEMLSAALSRARRRPGTSVHSEDDEVRPTGRTPHVYLNTMHAGLNADYP